MLVVVDLDRTILKVDSFPKWVIFLLEKTLSSRKVRLFLFTLYFVILRALNLIDHQSFKMKLMAFDYPTDWNEQFAQTLIPAFQESVIDYLKTILRKHPTARFVVSTAAPVGYVENLLKNVPFKLDKVIASRIQDRRFIDNSGEAKAESFKQAYPNTQCDLFITDHHSDIPMMRMSKLVILVKPSKRTLALARNNGIFMRVLSDCCCV